MHPSVLVFNFTSLSSPQLHQLQFALTVSCCDVYVYIYFERSGFISAHVHFSEVLSSQRLFPAAIEVCWSYVPTLSSLESRRRAVKGELAERCG